MAEKTAGWLNKTFECLKKLFDGWKKLLDGWTKHWNAWKNCLMAEKNCLSAENLLDGWNELSDGCKTVRWQKICWMPEIFFDGWKNCWMAETSFQVLQNSTKSWVLECPTVQSKVNMKMNTKKVSSFSLFSKPPVSANSFFNLFPWKKDIVLYFIFKLRPFKGIDEIILMSGFLKYV